MKNLSALSVLSFGAALGLAIPAIGCGGPATADNVSTTSATVPGAGATQSEPPILHVRVENAEAPSRSNTAVFLEANRLAPPGDVAPGATVYKVWIQSPGRPIESLGAMLPDANRAASFDTVAPYDQFLILITPEASTKVAQPTHDPVSFYEVGGKTR